MFPTPPQVPPHLPLETRRPSYFLPLTGKTVYIISYSSDIMAHDPHAERHLTSLLPPSVPALLTVWCQTWRAPPSEICALYSGVSGVVQGVVKSSARAMAEVEKAVAAVECHLGTGQEVALVQTTCHAGTHRSVAAAEIIAKRLRRRGARVGVVHAHRRRRVGDLY